MSELYSPAYREQLRLGVVGLLGTFGLSSRCEVSLLTVSENATFRVVDPQTGLATVVRVHRAGYHTVEEIDSELAWIEALRREDIVITPAPLARTEGGHIAHFADGMDTRQAVAFEFMSGNEPPSDEALVANFHTLGGLSARLHRHARQWSRPPGFIRKTWNLSTTIGDTPHWGHWQDCADIDASGREILERVSTLLHERLAAYGEDETRFGLVHADLRLANLLVEGDRLAVIDFDDCGFGWFVYDFAAAVSFIEEENFVPELRDAWITGYREEASLSAVEVAAINDLVMLRRMMLTAWLNTHAETPTAAELGAGFAAGTVRLARRMLDTGSPLAR